METNKILALGCVAMQIVFLEALGQPTWKWCGLNKTPIKRFVYVEPKYHITKNATPHNGKKTPNLLNLEQIKPTIIRGSKFPILPKEGLRNLVNYGAAVYEDL